MNPKIKIGYQIFIFSIVFILITTSVSSEVIENLDNLATYESITYDFNIDGGFELIKESDSAKLQDLTANLLFKVQQDNNYVTLYSESTSSEGKISNSEIIYTFTDMQPLNKEFSYSAKVKIDSSKHLIQKSTKFPLKLTSEEISLYDLDQYLEATETIDWQNDEIKRKASSLAQGQTDLFNVLVILSSWVESNIEYNLSTLNAEASLSASSVLSSREGVCDEMTSLFISFSRSLGIPARFVSGLTYTRSDLFDEPWQSHGWAEVYLPNIGWVSFDPTFGQYGYVDATHIPLKYSIDPTEASIQYQWTANKLNLVSGELDLTADISKYGYQLSPSLAVSANQFLTTTDFGSYNLITAMVKNKKNSYQAVELNLVVPKEIEIISKNKDVLVIEPLGEVEKKWMIKVSNDLKSEYIYSFPYYVFANSIINATNTFNAAKNNPIISYEELSSLLEEETTSLNTKIDFSCSYPKRIEINDSADINCQVKNTGNQVIDQVKVCVTEVCEIFELLLSESKSVNTSISFDTPGYQNIQTTAEIGSDQNNQLLTILVLDPANIELTIDYPKLVNYNDQLALEFNLEKTSVSIPENIILDVKTSREKYSYQIDSLENSHQIILDLEPSMLGKKNNILFELSWTDELEHEYSSIQEIQITVESSSIIENFKLYLNQLVGFFSIQ